MVSLIARPLVIFDWDLLRHLRYAPSISIAGMYGVQDLLRHLRFTPS